MRVRILISNVSVNTSEPENTWIVTVSAFVPVNREGITGTSEIIVFSSSVIGEGDMTLQGKKT